MTAATGAVCGWRGKGEKSTHTHIHIHTGRLCINNHDSTLEGSINIVDPGGINIAEKTCWVFSAGAELTILTCKRR